jgi:flavin reductase (DIM6/NTAB) family NADH-FMN oxidoreductase RutF
MRKIELDAGPFMYPMSVVIAGVNIEDKPTYTTVAFNGIINYQPPMIMLSMNKNNYINKGINKHLAFSVNFPSVSMLNVINYFGTVSGSNVDKSKKVRSFYSQSKNVPMIEACPVNLECELITALNFNGSNDIFVGEIIRIYCNENSLINGKPDLGRIKPVLLTLDTMKYWEVGKVIGEPERIYE